MAKTQYEGSFRKEFNELLEDENDADEEVSDASSIARPKESPITLCEREYPAWRSPYLKLCPS
eukprot:CAMPEP_0170454066 /NCGR_PEP_ID=MMETSP0123-20130129/2441_1 /TAXON_ID=182087 /ORGANISM="Favella ehrenbergii, Strain Fehren 1" /LENGTH=62 /DNA_ID=CAMNT_0010716653 /DNA_START=1458 /DNA_END=1647 /DNA_ORIENTATION=+